VVAPPACDATDFLEAVEDLAVEQLVRQASVEAFDIAVLPRASRLDIEGCDAQPSLASQPWTA